MCKQDHGIVQVKKKKKEKKSFTLIISVICFTVISTNICPIVGNNVELES